jgi:hypothetical protein
MARLDDMIEFYAILNHLKRRIGGERTLFSSTGRMAWPQRGVYFFMEEGQCRSDTGIGSRVVRVGTHALKAGSKTTLWRRLSQHKGQTKSGGGNHRGSIFRLIVGTALGDQEGQKYPTWGLGNNAPKEIRIRETDLERAVSKTIGRMPFVWLEIGDEPSATSKRGYIERNSIALLSNYGKPAIDPASSGWLGHRCNRERVRKSGLWNQNHVDETYDPTFLSVLQDLVERGQPT